MIKCPVCHGIGGELDRFEHNKWNKCIFCKGEGKVDLQQVIKDLPQEVMFIFSAYVEAKLKESQERIANLEEVLKKLTDLGEGRYTGWRGFYEDIPYCMYCFEDWDQMDDTDAHKDNCPIAIARRLLDG